MIRAVLFDLDGVLRHFDPTHVAQIERRHSLAPGSIHAVASARISFAKPDRRAFQHVLDVLELAAHEVFFTDDSVSKLTGADALGIRTHHFTDIGALRAALADGGVRPAL